MIAIYSTDFLRRITFVRLPAPRPLLNSADDTTEGCQGVPGGARGWQRVRSPLSGSLGRRQ